MNKKMVLTIIILLAVIAAGTFSIVLASNNFGDNLPETTFLPPLKQTAVAYGETLRAANLALPQITKSSKPVKSYSLPASCPAPTQATGIVDFRFGPFSDGKNLVNWVSALGSTGDYYNIWAGAPADTPQKGLLRVGYIFADSCCIV